MKSLVFEGKSQNLSKKDRVIYRFDDEAIYIFAIGGHDDDE
jgi:toxin YoeB